MRAGTCPPLLPIPAPSSFPLVLPHSVGPHALSRSHALPLARPLSLSLERAALSLTDSLCLAHSDALARSLSLSHALALCRLISLSPSLLSLSRSAFLPLPVALSRAYSLPRALSNPPPLPLHPPSVSITHLVPSLHTQARRKPSVQPEPRTPKPKAQTPNPKP
jgi:hypothetical protein